MNRITRLTVVFMLFIAPAAAQDFLFTSNRIRAVPEADASGNPLSQNELFRYMDGSEIRLTFTPGMMEWDPSPSPSGRFAAYVVSDTLHQLDKDEIPEDWNWYLRIMDLESLMLVEEWQLPAAKGDMRAPGGFRINWHEDEQSLLVQLQSRPGEYRIAQFQVGVAEPRILGAGFGIHLDPVRGWIATLIEGYVTIVDPFSGMNHPLMPGDPLGWVGDRVVIGGPGPLILMNPVTAEVTEISGRGDGHAYFTTSPDASHYAWLTLTLDGTAPTVTVADADFKVLHEFAHDGYIGSMTWAGPDSLLLSGMTQNRLTIDELRTVDGAIFPLVGWSDSELPALVPSTAP